MPVARDVLLLQDKILLCPFGRDPPHHDGEEQIWPVAVTGIHFLPVAGWEHHLPLWALRSPRVMSPASLLHI